VTLSAGSRLGPYEILAPLGAGGMGEVWRALDTRLGRDVALKLLPLAVINDPERLARFEREAHVLASLNHPHIAAIYGVEDSAGTKALVLELVEGETLAERIDRGALSIDETVTAARQIASALEAAHEKGVVHRDLKPQNVKLSPDGQVKVLDFGLAKALDSAAPSASAPSTSPALMNSPTLTSAGTQLGVILGTAAYMAPEQARGGPVDKRADVFAFGCVVYEMLTGRRAFSGETVSDTLAAVLRGEADWSALPAETPAALRRLLERCLEKDRKRRLRDLGDAGLELEPASLAATAGLAASPGRQSRSWAWLARGIAAGALVALALSRILLQAPAPGRGPVRLLLAAPAGSTFHDAPAVSPDGRQIAFLTRDAGGKLSRQVRGVGGSEGTPLAAFEGEIDTTGNHPGWSPDSSALAFCDGKRVRVAELIGGAVRALADCTPSARGVSWGSAGILYAPSSDSALFLVEPQGGAARAVSPFDDKVPDLSHRFPSFLPDGRRYLYLAWSNAAGAPADHLGVFLGDLRSGSASKVSDLRSNVVPVGEGAQARLLFQRDGKLVASGFDPSRGAITAGETVVESAVEWFANGGYAYFTVNARGDLMSLPPQSHQMSVLSVLDRFGADQGQVDIPAMYTSLAVSPDGKRLAATVTDLEHGLDDVWVIDVERKISTRLTRGPDTHYDLVWRPDGQAIAYGHEATGMIQPYVIPADGSTPETPLITTTQSDAPAAFSSDGVWLVLERNVAGRRSELWAHSLRDGHEVALCRFPAASCTDAALSPDGRALAYVSDFSGRAEVYVRPFLAEGPQLQISNGGGREPLWRADSGEINFRDTEGWMVAATVSTQPQLQVQPAERLFLVSNTTVIAPSVDHGRYFISGRSAGGATLAHATLDWRPR
jgi:eukaryotic-like serine/threonine-protein kinase